MDRSTIPNALAVTIKLSSKEDGAVTCWLEMFEPEETGVRGSGYGLTTTAPPDEVYDLIVEALTTIFTGAAEPDGYSAVIAKLMTLPEDQDNAVIEGLSRRLMLFVGEQQNVRFFHGAELSSTLQ